MSDMIERLSLLSQDAGNNAAESLAARSSIESMEARIRSGVRRRHRHTIGLAATAALLAGAGVIVVPLVVGEVPVPPIAQVDRQLERSLDGLNVYSDGSMSVVTSRGRIVEVEAPDEGDEVRFRLLGHDAATSPPDPDNFPLGWSFVKREYGELFAFGRPLIIGPDGPVALVQGGSPIQLEGHDGPPIAFQAETDAGVATHIALRATAYIVAKDRPGETVALQTQLNAAPEVSYVGDIAAGTGLGVVRTGPFATTWRTADTDLLYKDAYRRYVVVDAFLVDRAGTVIYLGTHRSWNDVVKMEDGEAQP